MTTKHRVFPFVPAFIFLCIAFALLFPQPSFANVRKTDIVCGNTVESMGLPASQCPDVQAQRSILLNPDGLALFERNADDQCHIASITKVMTAIVACENAPLDLKIIVSKNAAAIGESSASLQEGDELTLTEALKALLWPSGNDAAIAIAESVGARLLQNEGSNNPSADDSYKAFVTAMNNQAKKLNMTNSLFSNPHGLDTDTYSAEEMHSSARDVATMCAYAMSIESIRSITSLDGGICVVTRGGTQTDLELQTTDELIGVYEGTQGVKTGFTDPAGYCFAGSCERNNVRYIAISLGCESPNQRFRDCENLWNWGYDHRIEYSLAHSSKSVNGLPVVAEVACTAWPNKTVAATLEDASQTIPVFNLAGNVSEQATFTDPAGGVKKGDKLGTVTYYQRNKVIATATLVAAADQPAPNPFEGISIWWQRLFGGAQAAESYLVDYPPLIYDKAA